MSNFIPLELPSRDMTEEAVKAGALGVSRTFKRAERAQAQSTTEQLSLLDALPAGEGVAVATITDEDEELDDDFEPEDA